MLAVGVTTGRLTDGVVTGGGTLVGHNSCKVAVTVIVVPTVCASVCVSHSVTVLAAGQIEVGGAAAQPLACRVMGKHLVCPKSGWM